MVSAHICSIWLFFLPPFFQLAGLLEVLMCVLLILLGWDSSSKPEYGGTVTSSQLCAQRLFSFPRSTGISVLCPSAVDHLLRMQCSLISGLYQGNHWSNWQLRFTGFWSDAHLLKTKVVPINCIGDFTWNSIPIQTPQAEIFTFRFYPEV